MAIDDLKTQNINLLKSVVALVPNQGILVSHFAKHYPSWPNAPDEQVVCEELILQLLTWYLGSAESHQERTRALEAQLQERTRALEAQLQERTRALEAQLQERTRAFEAQLQEKAKLEATLQQEVTEAKKRAQTYEDEARNVVSSLIDQSKRPTGHSWGSKTRARAWHELEKHERVQYGSEISTEDGDHVTKGKLERLLQIPDSSTWTSEDDMYDPLHKALNSVLKILDSPFTAVQTHNSSLFPADLSCSQYGDERLLHGLSFFLEWKARGVKLDSPEHCGQLVDYFNQVQSVQRYRSTFISVLSNYDSAWIFIASYAKDGAISVTKRPAASLADAILYANRHSAQQVSDRIPKLDRRIAPPDNQYEILDASRRSFLLSLDMPPPGPHVGRESGAWRAPTRHTGDKFVVKIRHDGDVEAIRLEIKVLLKLRDSKVTSLHVPELVWAPRVEPQYGITPLGRVINFRQSGRISRRIVEGLLDGLEYLHGQGIVHRDIRPSNLVLDKVDNVIIIDYETAETIPSPREVEYFGGYICWPPRLLESESPVYRPDASDDLLASILVVLHLLFPSQFDTFRVTNIRPGTEQKYRTAETAKLLELWKTVKESAVWGRFVVAAARKRYGELREMSQVFCHI